MSFLRGLTYIALAGVACGAAYAQAVPVEDLIHDRDKLVTDEVLPPPLTRVREGGTPYDPNQTTEPYAVDLSGFAEAEPKTGTLRTVPEYEPTRGVLYKFIQGHWHQTVIDCVVALTADPAYDEIAYVLVNNPSQQATAESLLIANGADMSKVEFIIMSGNSIWIRDYGPQFVFQDETLVIVDPHYYPGRPWDNFVPTMLGDDHWDMPTYDIGLYYSGGNFMPGPNNEAFVTSLIRLDNPVGGGFNDDLILEFYTRFKGVETLHILGQLPFSVDGTGHIDMWFNIVDEQNVIISEFKPGSNQTAINVTNNGAAYMASLGFNVYRTPAWNVGSTHYTYTNAYRVNDRIFIPRYADGNPAYAPDDAAALAAWQAAAGPGVEIVTINCYNIIPAAGAIHCIIMQVPRYVAPEPAAVVLSPFPGQYVSGAPGRIHQIKWNATDTDNADLASIDLYFSTDDGMTWSPIVTGYSDLGSYEWNVPGVTSTRARIKVVAHSGSGNVAEAISDRFTLTTAAPSRYDFAFGAGIFAKAFGHSTLTWSQIDSVRLPVTDPITDFDADAYSKIAFSDAWGGTADPNRYVSPIPGSGRRTTHVFEFTIFENPSEINQIELHWEGFNGDCAQAELYVWDYVEGRYGDGRGLFGQNRYADSITAHLRDGFMYGYLDDDFDRYIDGDGKLTMLVRAQRINQRSYHDYVSVTVIAGAPNFCPEDLNGDGTVGHADLAILLAAYGSVPGDPNWNPVADLNGDDEVGHADLAILLAMYGNPCP